MMTKSDRDWLKFLNPEELYKNFIKASLFLTGYEILKESIVDNLKSFFINGFKDNKTIYSEDYNTDVLELDKKGRKLQSSIKWLRKNNVINDEDVNMIEQITIHRNDIAHELFKYISDTDNEINEKYLLEIKKLIKKIDRWWIIEVELPTESEMTEEKWKSVDFENVNSMRMIEFDYLVEIVMNPNVDKEHIYKKFKDSLVK